MSRGKKLFLYTLYTVVVTLFFVYFLFPGDDVKTFIQSTFSKNLPNSNIELEIDRVRMRFPLGLKLDTISVSQSGALLFDLDHMNISPMLLSIFNEQKSFYFNGKSVDGLIKGKADIMMTERDYKLGVDLTMNGLELSKIPAMEMMPDYKISGIVDGFVTYKSEKKSDGTARGNIVISNVNIGLEQPVLNLKNVGFASIKSDWTLDPRQLQIKKCTLEGSQVEGQLTGSIMIRKPYEQSRLNLRGFLKPQPDLVASLKNILPESLISSPRIKKRGLPFTLKGTVNSPQPKLM